MLKKCFLLGLSAFYISTSVFAADTIEPVSPRSSSTLVGEFIRLSSSSEIVRPVVPTTEKIGPLTRAEAIAKNRVEFRSLKETGALDYFNGLFPDISYEQYLSLMTTIYNQKIKDSLPPNIHEHFKQVSHFFTAPEATPRILTLDGGGVRGVIEARILQYIEEITGKRITDLFDLIVASSTGAIIACAASEGHSMKEIIEIYRKESPTIFTSAETQGSFSLLRSVVTGGGVGVKYQDSSFIEVLKKYFGDKMLADLKANIIITGCNLESTETILFSSKEARSNHAVNYPVFQAIKAASSAPNYFSCELFEKSGSGYIPISDGGSHNNNPTMIAALKALEEFNVSPNNAIFISLGTGYTPIAKEKLNLGGLHALDLFQTLVLNGQAQHSMFTQLKKAYEERDCSSSKESGVYHRFQHILPKELCDFDNSTKENFDNLINFTEAFIEENKSLLQSIAELLTR